MTTAVITVSPETAVSDIAALLLDRRISAVPVVDGSGKLVGIVSEGDLLRRPEADTDGRRSPWLAALADPESQAAGFIKTHGRWAADVMSRKVITVEPDAELAEVARLLEQRRIKRVPVVEDGHLVGIVSRANLLHGLVAIRPPAAGHGGDPAIRQAVQEAVDAQDWVDRRQINIVVENGVVHFWGIVRSEEERRALRLAAENVAGVRSVQEHFSPNWFANLSG